MKENRIKKLSKELDYLLDEERQKEIENYNIALDGKDVDIHKIAEEIYKKRGIDYKKINKGFLNKLVNALDDFATIFKSKDNKLRKKMIIDIIYMVVLLVLLKIPFDLVTDLVTDYLYNITTKSIYFTITNLLSLLLYTIVLIATFFVLIRNFNTKYSKS